jgi:hypothetical protein
MFQFRFNPEALKFYTCGMTSCVGGKGNFSKFFCIQTLHYMTLRIPGHKT